MTDGPVHPLLWAVVVTFHRPAELTNMLAKLAEQTRPPDRVIVVDNGSQPEARHAADEAGATYLDAGDNLGPAGGIALGMQHVLDRADDRDWVVLCDDDDPPGRTDLFDLLWTFAARSSAQQLTAGVGVGGARYDRRWGVFKRVHDAELHGTVSLDYIGGGQFPFYACGAVRRCGVPDDGLFFGFDDADYGLRLRKAGYALLAEGELWREHRARFGRLDLGKKARRTSDAASYWRRYYAVRNSTIIARRYGTGPAVVVASMGGSLRAAAALIRARRPLREVAIVLRAGTDGLLGRVGRTVDPGTNTKASDASTHSGALRNPRRGR